MTTLHVSPATLRLLKAAIDPERTVHDEACDIAEENVLRAAASGQLSAHLSGMVVRNALINVAVALDSAGIDLRDEREHERPGRQLDEIMREAGDGLDIGGDEDAT